MVMQTHELSLLLNNDAAPGSVPRFASEDRLVARPLSGTGAILERKLSNDPATFNVTIRQTGGE